MKDYYIGLDMGTDSVGWAVTDTDYNVMKFKGNAMWGIRLFDESNTAEERRGFRSARRRAQRKKDRTNLLNMLFDEEISKKDIAFFRRLQESNLYSDDKSVNTPYAVFADEDFTDRDYHKLYPTIYHLRKELITNKSPHDVRLVYLAIHHIIKNRGHFLFDSVGMNEISSFDKVFVELIFYLRDNYDVTIECADKTALSNVLKNRLLGKTKKSAEILSLCSIKKKESPQAAAIMSSLSGATIKFCDLFDDEELKEAEFKSFSFAGNFDDNESGYQSLLGERYELVEKLKAIYDWAVLADILKNNKYISYAKVDTYNQHKSDLKTLKSYVKQNCKNQYDEIFRVSKKGIDNYVAYSGVIKNNGHTGVLDHKCNQEDFCAYLKKVLPKPEDNIDYFSMFEQIESSSFMPKQVTKDNGVVPMQINRAELVAILDNAKNYLPFLNSVDNNGISVYEKIVSIFDYRIPYYVGPLNTHSKNSWIIRNEGKIYPWNFDKIVDVDKSAEAFINNLTSKCTYLPDKDVIPKCSLLYCKFMVLNELNNLRLNGEKISVDLKKSIYKDLFETHKKVTLKALKGYLTSNGYKDVEITGIDAGFKSSLKSYIDLKEYNITTEEKEDVVMAITIFGDDKKLLRKRLKNELGNKLSEDEIIRISKLKYTGWSALSKEFLTEIESVNPATGEVLNIISALWETNDNLMMLLSSSYQFADNVEKAKRFDSEKTLKEMVEDLYVSPKVKRPIYQSLKIVKELVKINGCAPKKVFVEVARGEEEKKRTVSRKNKLIELYKYCKKESEQLYQRLVETPEDEFKRDKLYLYYTQFGKCMYSGEQIVIENLYDNNVYDIDHIFPRSKVKDDSIDNRVLVKKTINAGKDNEYPLSENIRTKMFSHWRFLLNKELISKKKFERLTRNYPLSDDELSDFIARQLVETRQSTKAVATLLGQLYPRPQTEIVYVKASIASDFRHQYDMLKCREVNDFHHAKDAYLNIVVGNVYNERFTHNRINFIKGLQTKNYSLNCMFNYNVENAWVADNDKSISTVKRMMNKNNILYTRYSFIQTGGLFDQMPVKKGLGQVPLKLNSPRSDISKYGAYNRPSSSFFSFVEYENEKGKSVRALIPIDSYIVDEYNDEPIKFMEERIGLKNPKVIIPCVKYNACLSFDGYRMHISSKSGGGKTIVYKPGAQLILGYKWEKYVKNVTKYLSQNTDREVTRFDGISSDENIELYSIIAHKMTDTVLKINYAKLGAKLLLASETFSMLSVKDQCYTIAELLKIIHANVMSGDLSLIGESKKSGITTSNSRLSDVKGVSSIKLINQSVTGLFESSTELVNNI